MYSTDLPDSPDLSAATWAGALSAVENLPLRRQIQAAAQTGGKVTVNGIEYDFSGLSDADYQKQYADAMAQTVLDLQKQYGPAYIQQRLDELKASDPQGWAQRKQLYKSIMSDLQGVTEADPQAVALENQMLDELEKGGTLDPEMLREVQQASRRGQAARGNTLGTAATLEEAQAVTSASDALRSKRQADALQFLTSGSSPDDIRYRKRQQAISNLSSFVSGTTPLAQFKGLTGAQAGAAPTVSTITAQGLDPNAGQTNAANAVTNYRTASQVAQNTANPWLAGLSGAASGLSAWSAWNS